MAVQRRFKDASTGKREADFIQVVAWRQQADFLTKYAAKGDKVTIRGSIQTRSFEKDGVKKYITEINADEVELDKKRERGEGDAPAHSSGGDGETFTDVTDEITDELPF